jgi:hypothetical protein
LAVKYKYVSKDASRRQLRVRLGQRKSGHIDMADRIVGGVAGSYPCREAHGILSRRNRDHTWLARRRRLAEQCFTGEAERSAIQLDVEVSWMMFARFVTAHAPPDVLDAGQSCASVLVGRVTQPPGSDLLAPQPPGPLLANAGSPRR